MKKSKQYEIFTDQIENKETLMAMLEKMPSAVSLISYEISGMITLAYALGIIDQKELERMGEENEEYLYKLTNEEKNKK